MEAAKLPALTVPEANDRMVELVMAEFKNPPKGPIANKPSMGALLAATVNDHKERYKKMMLERKFNLIERELLDAFGLSQTEQLKKAVEKVARAAAMAALRSVGSGMGRLREIAGVVAAAAKSIDIKGLLPKRVAVIDSRYGTVVEPSTKGMNDGHQYLVTGFEKFTKEELKQHLGNGRHLENRYARVKNLLSLTPAQVANRTIINRYKNFTYESLKGLELSQEDMVKLKVILARLTNTRLAQGRYNGNLKFPEIPSLGPGRSVQTPKNSSVNSIMTDEAVKAALAELYKDKTASASTQNLIRRRVELTGTKNAALELIVRLRSRPTINLLKELSNVKFNDRTPLEELLVLRTSRQFPTLNRTLQNNLDKTLRTKMYEQANRISRENIDYQRLQRIATAVRNTRNNLPGSSTFKNSLKRYINRLGNRVDKIRSNENTIMRLASASRGLTGINLSLRNAQARIVRLRRRENNNRRSRGLPPQQQLLRNERIRYEPEPQRLRGYGNIPPVFAPPPNMRQPGIIPMPPPPAPPRALPVNNYRQTPAPAPQPLETYLPPMEQAAVENVGGVNKAINLVENAGGPSNIVKTANILKTVGNNPNAAIAAGANAKNVRIVLQLGGANNALKVASAVPKLKKRRKSKKPEPKPKPPRVKEIKKLIKYLGSKKNLVRRLPNEEDREKKLTKDQVVSKITRHLLRKN